MHKSQYHLIKYYFDYLCKNKGSIFYEIIILIKIIFEDDFIFIKFFLSKKIKNYFSMLLLFLAIREISYLLFSIRI